MAQQQNPIEYLSREIGPRPAGTEEEQQAALYISDVFQDETGFRSEIEDVASSSNAESPRTLCSILTVVVALVAIIFPPFMIPAALIAFLSAIVYAAEAMGRPLFSKMLAHGQSQNVVAKYKPHGEESGSRSRKIVLVAHYDSGKVKPSLVSKFDSVPVPWPLACLCAMIFVPVFLLIRALLFARVAGAGLIILNIITVIAALICALPAAKALLYRRAPLSEGANDNAAGVAVMLDIARSISGGLMNESDYKAYMRHNDSGESDGYAPVVHSADEAYGENLVPTGAEIEYRTERTAAENVSSRFDGRGAGRRDAEENGTAKDRLASAKAAIAAMTGATVSSTTYVKNAEPEVDVSQMVTSGAAGFEDAIKIDDISEGALSAADDSSSQGAAEFSSPRLPAEKVSTDRRDGLNDSLQFGTDYHESATDENVPDWFAAAQRKAKRSPQKPQPAQRSRYAEALDAALSQSSAYFEEANRLVMDEGSERLRARSADIVEVLPPTPGQDSVHEDDDVAVDDGASSQLQVAEADLTEYTAPQQAPAVDFTASESDDPVVGAQSYPDETAAFAPVSMTAEELASIGANDEAVESAAVVEPSEPAETPIEAGVTAPQQPVAPERPRRTIALPGFTGELSALKGSSTDQLVDEPDFQVRVQRAPLSAAEVEARAIAQCSSAAQVNSGIPMQESPSRSGALRALRTKLPSLSGSFERIGDEDVAVSNVSSVGSFVAAGQTSALDPVGDELIGDAESPEDVYIDDADDSGIEDYYTETGAYAGPDYVDMPKSRIRGFFDKFHFGSKKNGDDEITPQEWLDVDEEFDPRQAGKQRGGWESFRDDAAVGVDGSRGDQMYDDAEEGIEHNEQQHSRGNRRWQGGAMSRVRLGRVDMRSSGEEDEAAAEVAVHGAPDDVDAAAEINEVFQFRNPNFNTEVWFVALGSEVDYHDGIRQFIEAHRSELHGAMVVELDALGAGSLSYAEKEGSIKAFSPSARLKRFIQKAAKESGVACGGINMQGQESAASICAANGMQAIHVFGVENGFKALTSADEDVLENIDGQILAENTYFVEELVKGI